MLFPGFQQQKIGTPSGEIDLVSAGSGPPLLLLHGFPQTRAVWHLVAPELAQDFTVIVPDLPGYGRSKGPQPDAEGQTHSKRAMAQTMVALMESLDHAQFCVAGHDRGGRVAYRLALDHPMRVQRLALLDIMTTLDTWEAMDWHAAISAYHWPFLAQDETFVTSMIGHDPSAYLDHLLDRWKGPDAQLHPLALADYHQAIANPNVIAAMAADYRAGARIDVDHDRVSRKTGARIPGPLLVLRGTHYEPRPLTPAWNRWCDSVDEVPLDCGHFIAEEVPDACTRALRNHFWSV